MNLDHYETVVNHRFTNIEVFKYANSDWVDIWLMNFLPHFPVFLLFFTTPRHAQTMQFICFRVLCVHSGFS